MDDVDLISELQKQEYFGPIDIQFAAFINRLADDRSFELALAAALVSNFTQNGHICLDLQEVAGKPVPGFDNANNPLLCPGLSAWQAKLHDSNVVGNPGEHKPLILGSKSRLYLYRYWEYEQKLGQILKFKAETSPANINTDILRDGFKRLFPEKSESVNLQKLAAYIAATKNFCVISGGPGTGKTYTVAIILALLLEQDPAMKIALVAPTGKASARLAETIRRARINLNCADNIKHLLPEEASTIHAFLGSISNSPYFKYNERNRLPYDLVVVDESSMVDLALMSKLCQALHPQARLILLGDKDQLSSVEAGAALGDICGPIGQYAYSAELRQAYSQITGESLENIGSAGGEHHLRDCLVQLERSYRFSGQSGIGRLSQAINHGDTTQAGTILKSDDWPDLKWRNLPSPAKIESSLKEIVLENYQAYIEADKPEDCLERFNRFKVLVAVREGRFGVKAFNFYIENILQDASLIDKSQRWFHKRPVIITRNDYKLGLFNGDIGIIMVDRNRPDEAGAVFRGPDGTLRFVSPIRLPEHETVYAVTVHKSQGSEFDRVLLILPDKPSPVITRELLYTGVTRARSYLEIWCPEKIFESGLSRTTLRQSGLTDILWGNCPH